METGAVVRGCARVCAGVECGEANRIKEATRLDLVFTAAEHRQRVPRRIKEATRLGLVLKACEPASVRHEHRRHVPRRIKEPGSQQESAAEHGSVPRNQKDPAAPGGSSAFVSICQHSSACVPTVLGHEHGGVAKGRGGRPVVGRGDVVEGRLEVGRVLLRVVGRVGDHVQLDKGDDLTEAKWVKRFRHPSIIFS